MNLYSPSSHGAMFDYWMKRHKNKKAKSMKLKIEQSKFDTFYLLSLVYNKVGNFTDKEQKDVFTFVESFAQLIYKCGTSSCLNEIKEHAWDGGNPDECDSQCPSCKQHYKNKANKDKWCKINNDEEIFKIMGRRCNGKIAKKLLTMDECNTLFLALRWHTDFGGIKWARISKEIDKLEQHLCVFNEQHLRDAIMQIDHIIDLEHNTQLFLEEHCPFYLKGYLDGRSKLNEPKDFTGTMSENGSTYTMNPDSRILQIVEKYF